MSERPVVVTRAGAAGRALAESLAAAGVPALWLPSFEIGPAPDEKRVQEVLGRLDGFDLAVFVSPAAIDATAPRMTRSWPARTSIGAVGATSRGAVVDRIPGAREARLFAPEDADGDGGTEAGGSEALWRALQPIVREVRRALILRAAHGREWLGQQLVEAGVLVETLAVYSRCPAAVAGAAAARLRAWQEQQLAPAFVFSSSEAVETTLEQLRSIVSPAWIRSGRALATHERIGARLREAGFATVIQVAGNADSIHEAARAQ